MGACSSAPPSTVSDAQPAPLSVPSHRCSPMLLALQRDADAQAHLRTFLTLDSFARLHATCKQWSQWIEQPSAASRRQITRSLEYRPSQLAGVSACRWLLATVTEMCDVSVPPVFGRILPVGSNAGPMSTWKRYTDTLELMARCPQLQAWTTRFHHEWIPPVDQLSPLIVPAAANLRSLTLQPYGPDPAYSLNGWCSMLPAFTQLQSLRIHGRNECERVRLSPIVVLPRLSQFALLAHDRPPSSFPCSRLQAGCLAQCRALTDVDCGSWMSREGDDGMLDVLRMFVDSRVPSATEENLPLASLATLTRLQLHSTIMTAAVWDQLVRLPGLTDLSPLYWSPSIRADSIARLASFPQLRSCAIRSPPGQSPFDPESSALVLDQFLPALLLCQNLTSLTLDRVAVRKEQIVLLYGAHSCSLQSLSLPGCRIAGEDGVFARTLDEL